MPERIPQSIAIRVPLQAYLSSDHVSPATGKTIAVTISKNGAAYGNPSGGATNATAISDGSYYVDLSTTDTGTVGPLYVKGTEGTIDQVIAIYNVVVVSVTQTGDSFARIGAPVGASISADVAAVKASVGTPAQAATALSNVQWTNGRAALLDHLDADVSTRSTYAGGDTSGTTTLLSRLSAVRAGHLDNLSGGAVALASTALTTADLPDDFDTLVITDGGVSASLDGVEIEAGLNARQALCLIAAAVTGVGGDQSEFYQGAGVAVTRIEFSASGGERIAVTLHPPA